MITIVRDGAIGDALMMTPLVKPLLAKYGEVSLRVAPALHDRMYALLNCGALTVTPETIGGVINLNDAYELRPHMHPVEAYCEVAEINHRETGKMFCNRSVSLFAEKFDVVIHATKSWPNRTLSRSGFWFPFVQALHAKGLSVACIAQNQNEMVSGCDVTFLHKTLPEIAGIIAHRARVFIGGDSGPMHIAATSETPVIGLFTVALAERRYPYGRNEALFHGINAAVDCAGCLHRAPVPCRFHDCDFTDERKHRCIDSFDVNAIVEKTLSMREQFSDIKV